MLTAILFWLIAMPNLFYAGRLIYRPKNAELHFLNGVISFALGTGLFTYLFIFLGSFGLFSYPFVFSLGILLLFFNLSKSATFLEWIHSVFFFLQNRNGLNRFLIFAFTLSLLFTFVLCFLPEISNDALAYQLNLSKIFAHTGFIRPIYFEFMSYQSVLMNILYASALLCKSVAAAKLFHWFMGFFLILCLIHLINEETGDPKLGSLMGLMLLLTPTLTNQVTTTYVDIGAAFFIFLSAYLFLKRTDFFRDRFYSGVLLGLAVSVKYLALFACPAFFGLFLWEFARQRVFPIFIRRLALFILGASLGCGYWFIRNYALTGNPAFPYFGSVFGGENLPVTGTYFTEMGLSRSWLSFLLILWNMTFQPQYFDYHHWIGPAYIIGFPFYLISIYKEPKARPYALFTFLFTLSWFFIAQNARYLIPAFPFYLISVALGIKYVEKHASPKHLLMGKGITVFLSAFLLILTLYHYRYAFLVLTRIWSPAHYLTQLDRSYPIATWINQNLPQDAKILSREIRLFNFDRDITREDMLHQRLDYSKNILQESDLAAYLKGEGYTHVLNAIPSQKDQSKAHFRLELYNKMVVNPLLCEIVYSQKSSNIRENLYNYRVCRLK